MMDHFRKQGSPALRLSLLGAAMVACISCGGDSLASQPHQGTIQVGTTTVGAGVDPDGYTIAVNNAQAGVIPSEGTVYLEDLETGSYQVRLGGMSANCSTLPGENPVTVTVVAADTVNAEFEVTCDAPSPPGGGDPLP